MTTCAVDDCGRDSSVREYCGRHYQRLRLHGDVHYNHYDQTPSQRFEAKVDKSSNCWEWLASKNRHGYGRFKLNGKVELAHRVSYEMANGPIPEDMMLDHRCHNPSCVNPAHLRIVTSKQNQENRKSVRSDGGFRGVALHKERRRWQARVRHNRKYYFAGYYDTPEEAAEAAKALRLSLFSHNDADRRSA